MLVNSTNIYHHSATSKQIIVKLKEKVDALRDMNSAGAVDSNYNNYNNSYNNNYYYTNVLYNDDEPMAENKTGEVNETKGQPKSYLDDDLDDIIAKMDV